MFLGGLGSARTLGRESHGDRGAEHAERDSDHVARPAPAHDGVADPGERQSEQRRHQEGADLREEGEAHERDDDSDAGERKQSEQRAVEVAGDERQHHGQKERNQVLHGVILPVFLMESVPPVLPQ